MGCLLESTLYRSVLHSNVSRFPILWPLVNTVGSLLCSLPAEDFRPYLAQLEKTLDWIEAHHTQEIITDYCVSW